MPRDILSSFNRPKWIAFILLFGVIVSLYSVSFGHNFLFDEEDIIVLNPYVRDFSQSWKLFGEGFFRRMHGVEVLWEQYYRPLTAWTFAVDYLFWKLNPLGYNLSNTFLQLIVCYLFFLLCVRIFKNQTIAIMCAILYSVHTMHTEAVTYIASRGDILNGLFVLWALISYWDGRYARAALLYIPALFCKEGSILIPAYILLLDFVFIRSDIKKLVRRMLPFAVVAVTYLFFRKTICPIPYGPPGVEPYKGILRMLSMGFPMLEYFKAVLWPKVFHYCGQVDFATRLDSKIVITTLQVFGLIFAGWLLALRRRGAAFFGMTLFLVAMGPSYQFVHYHPEWAEHYMYVPFMGGVVLIGALIKLVAESKRQALIIVGLTIYVFVVSFWSFRTYQRNSCYVTNETFYTNLWESDSPYAYYGLVNLGIIEVMKGSWNTAYVPLRVSLEVNPESEYNNYNMGLYFYNKRDFKQAASYFQKAYDSKTGNGQPMYIVSKGMALAMSGEYQQAQECYVEGLKKLSEYAVCYKQLMRLYIYQGKYDIAWQWAQRGLSATSPAQGANYDIMLVESMVLAFIRGDDTGLRDMARQLKGLHPQPSWYRNAALVLLGEVDTTIFQKWIEEVYFYNKREGQYLVMMAHTLRGSVDIVKEYYDTNAKDFLKNSSEPLYAKAFLSRLRTFINSKQ